MGDIITLPVVPLPLPKDWKQKPSQGKSISSFVKRKVIPVGPAYLAHVRRVVHDLSFEEHDKHIEEEQKRRRDLEQEADEEDDLGVGDEEETEDLLSLDPKEWKKQDNYAVLGLSHLRYRATPEQIKIAHRKKVLKHHPDKKAGTVGDSNDDAFFKCIQKANDVLTHPEKRRQFDSVDPYYDLLEADVPTAQQVTKAKNPNSVFFRLFAPVFEREARFSRKEPVPLLGEYADPKEKVEASMTSGTISTVGAVSNTLIKNRDDKRYTEKKNKAERARRKKEDTARLRNIVDVALSVDPRIKRIKQEEKEAREAKRKNKPGAGVKEEADKVAKAEAKKAKAAAANAAKKARRVARAETGGTAETS
ncbi:DnaJ domain-containing protein [Multifurca ochricompacta]|uniref:DnaJ domain-containing protein n=1 Tax=Multifurca ochricompacta TaxID=376703 RepID=A0AAD4M2X4_9AGAM|nr:DnaJ domain-containing protein [Multifurca ochricompacta]